MLRRALVVGIIVWPLLLTAAVWQRVSSHEPRVWTGAVYLAASRVCHQQAERSFHTHDIRWPVCARCAGLYVAAPFGLLLAPALSRVGRQRLVWAALVAAAVPTMITVGWEWVGGPMPPHVVRFASALPLGSVVAAAVVAMTHRLH